MVEYIDEWAVKNLKTFCQDNLPTLSKRLDLKQFEFTSPSDDKLPVMMLLSVKKDTPVIWRVLTGLYHRRFIFYDAQVCLECESLHLFSFFLILILNVSKSCNCKHNGLGYKLFCYGS